MNVDIISSNLLKKITEFKNFPFQLNHFIEEQSLLSLFSEPYPVSMSDLETDELSEIKRAYRDLNKSFFPQLLESNSRVLLLELGSELNEICKYESSYFNSSSISLLADQPSCHIVKGIEKFRGFKSMVDRFAEFASKYEKVILLKNEPASRDEFEFLDALHTLIENRFDNLLIYTTPPMISMDSQKDVPLEHFNTINSNLKKFISNNYYDQILFEEKLKEDFLSVDVNHIEPRKYIFDLYKDGEKITSSRPTFSRKFKFHLEEKGKYRIRVNLEDGSIEPRFTKTYEYTPSALQEDQFEYIELAGDSIDWKVDVLIAEYDIKGLIGNPYPHPEGYNNLPVLLEEEVENSLILPSYKILDQLVLAIDKMEPNTAIKLLPEYKDTHTAIDNLILKHLKHRLKETYQ